MRTYACVTAALLVVCCASHRQPESAATSKIGPVAVAGTYVHAGSGISFPETLGKFRRVSVNQYDPAASNIGVGYNLEADDLEMAVTVYVYPHERSEDGSPLPLSREFERGQAEIAQYHQIAEATSPWVPPRTQNQESTPGHAIGYRYDQEFSGRQQRVESVLYLFEHEGWLIKYRITYPQSQSEKGSLVSQVFVSIFKWREGA